METKGQVQEAKLQELEIALMIYINESLREKGLITNEMCSKAKAEIRKLA